MLKRSGELSMRWAGLFLAALIPLAAVPVAAPARAQMRAIVPVPYNDTPPAEVAVSLVPKEPRIGGMAAICFSTSRAGFMTLWNVATNGSVARVFPNSYSQADQQDRTAMRVEPTRNGCVGAGADSFRFRVDGPAGTEDLYLLWTARPDLQPRGGTFDDAQAFAQALQRVGQAGKGEWAVQKVTYDIVPVAGAAAPVMPQPQPGTVDAPPPRPPQPQPAQQQQPPQPQPSQQQAQNDVQEKPSVFILAMGANVEKLTKTNQDAKLYSEVMAEAFAVPKSNVRLLENATKDDWMAGFNWLRTSARRGDYVFIYFSGHGAQIDDPTGTSADGKDELLIPYDFETKHPGSAKYAVFSQELARWINALPTRNVVTVLDACHSAGLYRSIEGDVLGARAKFYRMPADTDLTRPEGLDRPATRSAGGTNRVAANGVLFAAARRDQSALEGSAGGFFTMALLREIVSAKSGTLADAYQRAEAKTRENTRNRQNPESVGPMDVPNRITLGQ